MARRQVLAAICCGLLAGCSAIGNLLPGSPGAVGRTYRESFRDSLGISSDVGRTVAAQASPGKAAQGFCVTSWKLGEGSADLYAVTPQAQADGIDCGGLPVLLLRPVCLLTPHEAWYYPTSAPFVALRCPSGASVWVTGFVKP
jgi:hypothetical protein